MNYKYSLHIAQNLPCLELTPTTPPIPAQMSVRTSFVGIEKLSAVFEKKWLSRIIMIKTKTPHSIPIKSPFLRRLLPLTYPPENAPVHSAKVDIADIMISVASIFEIK